MCDSSSNKNFNIQLPTPDNQENDNNEAAVGPRLPAELATSSSSVILHPEQIMHLTDGSKRMLETQDLELEDLEEGMVAIKTDENNIKQSRPANVTVQPSAVDSSSMMADNGERVVSTENPASNRTKPHFVGSHRVAGRARRPVREQEQGDGEESADYDESSPVGESLPAGAESGGECTEMRENDDRTSSTSTTNTMVKAVVVSREDIEQEVRTQLFEEAVEAEVVKEPSTPPPTSNHESRSWILALVIIILIVAIVTILFIRSQDDSNDTSSSNTSNTTLATPNSNNTGPALNNEKEEDIYDFVYVIAMSIVNFCGHEVHRTHECGGHLATITSPEEKDIVDNLARLAMEDVKRNNYTSRGDPIPGVWIGGEQFKHSRNDSGPEDPGPYWRWVDDSPWFDSEGDYWAPGEPDNLLDDLNNKTEGQHHLMLNSSFEYIDRNGCFGKMAPKAPGIYILPKNYYDANVYPNCRTSTFLREHDTPVPPRPEPQQLYVVNMFQVNFCGHVDRVIECGGHLASITNTREKAIVDNLKDNALAEAIVQELENTDSVWIGGQQIQGMNDTAQYETNVVWGWTDGSEWFDNNGIYWAEGQPDNGLHTVGSTQVGEHVVMLTQDGEYIDDFNSCFGHRRAVGIYILPSDYSDRLKYPDCRTGFFSEVVPVPPRS